jgi:tetratricopeptide (TPR) repeat protein
MTDSIEKAPRPRLSVAMIVRNEQQVLAGSIEGVRAIADQIVVLDTGSTDQTAAVAERLGAVVGRAGWTDDFSAARNRCLELAGGDWVLWLDAGERLDADSAAELRRFIDLQADPGKAYVLWVEMPSSEPAACREQMVQLRLMPNRPDLRFAGRVRESLQSSIEAAGLGIDAAVGRIYRHPRDHDPFRKEARARRNLRLAELEASETSGTPARLHLVVGDAQSGLGNAGKAREAFLAAIEAAEHGSTEMLEAYYGLLTTYDGNQADAESQLKTCLEALDVFPLDAQLLLAMGSYLQGRGRADLATRSFQAAVDHGQVDLAVWHLVDLAEVASDYLNLSLQIQGRDDEACRVLDEALRRNPDSIRLRRRLLSLHVKRGRCEEALALADQLPAGPEGRRPLADAVRGACQAVAKRWTAALGYLQAAYVAGCRDPLCLRWLSVALLSKGQVDAARPVLAEWQRLEPANSEIDAYLAAIQQPRQHPESRPPQPEDARRDIDDSGRQIRLDPGGPIARTTPPGSATVGRTPNTGISGAPNP